MKYIKHLTAVALAALLLTSCGQSEVTCGPGVPEARTEENAPSTTTTHDPNAPAATAAPLPDGVAEQYALAELFDRPINRIVLTSGISGYQYTALDTDIDRIADFFRPIRGIAPHSARGYYGTICNLILYNGPIEVGRFYLTADGGFGTGHDETVNGHDYAILYHISGRTADEIWSFVGRYFPADFATTAVTTADPHRSDYPETTVNHVWGTAQDRSEISTTTAGFDYSSLKLPDYRTENPVRYLGVDSRGMQSNGWQDFGLSGELRTVPQAMGSTYLYQTYSYFIRNDLTHLYPRDPIPSDPAALAEWLTDIRKSGRRALWYSMGILPSAVELTGYETMTAESGAALGRASYLLDGEKWVLYILCEEGTASVFGICPNEDAEYVYSFTDGIAKSYRLK